MERSKYLKSILWIGNTQLIGADGRHENTSASTQLSLSTVSQSNLRLKNKFGNLKQTAISLWHQKSQQ